MSGLPFWLGGPLLAVPTVVHFAVFRRSLGMSGALERVLHPRRALEADRLEDALDEESELVSAMEEATRAEFGDRTMAVEAPARSPAPRRARPVRLSETLAFLGAFVVAAAVVARFVPTPRGLRIDAAMVRAAGSDARAWLALVGGSLLVGLGARLSAGCTSGHGLSGCARRSPTSLAATTIFLAVAVGTALALRGLS